MITLYVPIAFVSNWFSSPVCDPVVLVGEPVFEYILLLIFVKVCHW